MMADGNTSDGYRKLRSVFGDVTNQLGKRKSLGKEKCGVKGNKQPRVLTRPCTEINSLKGNFISSISKVPNENKGTDTLDLCKNPVVAKSTTEIDADLKISSRSGACSKEKNVIMGRSNPHDENKDPKILDFRREDAVSKKFIQVNVVDNDLAEGSSKIDLKGVAISGMGEMASENKMDPILTDLGRSRAIETEDHCRDKKELSKQNMISGIQNLDSEEKCSILTDNGKGRASEVIAKDLGDGAMASSKMLSRNEILNVLSLHGINAEANDDLVDSSATKLAVPTIETGADSVRDGNNCDENEAKVTSECTHSETDYQNYGDDSNVDSFVLSQSGSIDCNVLPESQESSELKKDDVCVNTSGSIDLIKTCSCSFCTKAAYILLDLQYQDTKARISAIKKSQKEATILVENNCRSKAAEKHGLGNSSRVSKLESDLMHQWRYLFQKMADLFEHESTQLETNLVPLTELREQCKTDLEYNATSSEKH